MASVSLGESSLVRALPFVNPEHNSSRRLLEMLQHFSAAPVLLDWSVFGKLHVFHRWSHRLHTFITIGSPREYLPHDVVERLCYRPHHAQQVVRQPDWSYHFQIGIV